MVNELRAFSAQLLVSGAEWGEICPGFVALYRDEFVFCVFREKNGFPISKLAVPQDGQFSEMVALWDGQIDEKS